MPELLLPPSTLPTSRYGLWASEDMLQVQSYEAIGRAELVCVQDEFTFFMEDAASKLLVVPASGNTAAEEAAFKLNVPVWSIALSWTSGICCTLACCSRLVQFDQN